MYTTDTVTRQKPPAPAPVARGNVPDTIEDLALLPDADKVLLSAVTASGCDAVAYYTPGEGNYFEPSKHYSLYSSAPFFESELTGFSKDRFAHTDMISENGFYYIPVKTRDGDLMGIVALHAPTDGFSRMQTPEEAQKLNDMHENKDVFAAKVRMGANIVHTHSDVFGLSGRALNHDKFYTLSEKIDDLRAQVLDFFATLPRESGPPLPRETFDSLNNVRDARELKRGLRRIISQYNQQHPSDRVKFASHLLGVADIMDLSIDALNQDSPAAKPLITREQADLLILLTILHDVGKAQMASSFFRDDSETLEEKKYFMERNDNHPLFTFITESLYAPEALMSASHHQSMERYTHNELEPVFGAGQHVSLLSKDITPESLSALSRIMRIADVAEAATDGERTSASLDVVLHDLAHKAGYDSTHPLHSPNVQLNARNVDPDCLCFLIDRGVFTRYGQMRDREKRESGHPDGWVNRDGSPKYDPEKTKAIGEVILDMHGWNEVTKVAISDKIRRNVAADPVMVHNAPPTKQNPALSRTSLQPAI